MDLGIISAADILQNFGFVGLIFIIWYVDYRRISMLLRKIENDRKIIENYEQLAKDIRDYIALNTQTLAKLETRMQYMAICPFDRRRNNVPRAADTAGNA